MTVRPTGSTAVATIKRRSERNPSLDPNVAPDLPMSVMGYDAKICGLPPTATQDKKGFRFYASSGEAQQAFMEAEQISFAEFQRIFDSVDMVHAYS